MEPYVLVFDDLSLREIFMEVGGVQYVLKEATAEIVAKRRANIMKDMKLSKGAVDKIGDIATADLKCLAECLFQIDKDKRIPVSFDTIRGWPGRVTDKMVEKLKELSEIDQESNLQQLLDQRNSLNEKIESLQKDAEGNGQETTSSGLK